MSDIKWIKITTDIFNDEKIRFIESLPDGDAILVIWFKLLVLAGRSNADGYIMLTEKIPYSTTMLTDYLRGKDSVIKTAVETFERLEMIQFDDDRIRISNWKHHQNVGGLDKIRIQNRERKQRQREREREQKQQDVTEMSRDVTHNVTQQNKIKDKDKEKDKVLKRDSRKLFDSPIDYDALIDFFNGLENLPNIRKLTDKRKKHIMSRLKDMTVEELKEVWSIANESEFLTGNNDRRWKADIDWLINENNIVKVLEGKFSRRAKEKGDIPEDIEVDWLDDYIKRLKERT